MTPAPLGGGGEGLPAALGGTNPGHRAMPPEVGGTYPPWLHPHLDAVFGRGVVREVAALNESAALDLRINRLKVEDREKARAALFHEGVEAARTPLSPLGLRVFARIPLATLAAFRDGLVEVQDEGSQIAALLADARPGMRVVDFCARAGGKTLALAGTMATPGHLVACDVSERRLERAAHRLRHAGAGDGPPRALRSKRGKMGRSPRPDLDRGFGRAP